MNPITLLLLGRRKTYRCYICMDKGYTEQIWKSHGEWVYRKVPCICTKKEIPHV